MSVFGSALDQTPENMNFLSPLGFRFMIKKTPTLNYFVQNVNMPGLHLQNIDIANPLLSLPEAGSHLQFDDLMLNFKVDEDLKNYLEIHNWIVGLGFPEGNDQFAALNADSVPLGEGIRSDCTLVIFDSDNKPNFQVTFVNAFPISLSSLIFDTTRSRPEFIDAAATFRYDFYKIEAVI